jgi:TPR repeat protein
MGNCLSCFQLATMYTQEEGLKNPEKAYYYLEKALLNGVSNFDDLHHIFKENQEVLAPIFLKNRSPSALVDKNDKQQVLNLHEAYVNELKGSFSVALGKDRLYQRAAGFIEDNKVWLIGVQVRYLVKQVLRFDHIDFLKAFRVDVSPILSEIGIWVLKNYETRQKDKGKVEKRKMV